jgi:hypothetical protein
MNDFDVSAFGAKGDGQTDDTAAIQAALDAAAKVQGIVRVPSGIYCCGRIRMPPHVGLVGNSTWAYRSQGGSILRLNDPEAACLIDITGAPGAALEGLSLQGIKDSVALHSGVAVPRGAAFTGTHAIFLGVAENRKEEENARIERCHITGFTGDAMHFDAAWCYIVRHCQAIYNRGHALSVRGWDGTILDNMFSGNGGAGFLAHDPNASGTLTGNRIEWNAGGGIRIEGGGTYNITGNWIDRSGGPGIALMPRPGPVPCNNIAITGNVINRSGKPETTGSDDLDSTHVRIEEAHGVAFVGNTMCVGQDDGGGVFSPRYGMVLRGLKNCVIANNVMNIGAVKELVHDLGGHGEGVVIRDNVGNLYRDEGKTIWASGQL